VLKQLQEKGLSERQCATLLPFSRNSLRYQPKTDNVTLRQRVIELAEANPRYGYRRVWAVLTRQENWTINRKTVHRIWKQSRLQVRQKATRSKRSGKAVYPHKAECPNQVWTMDFVHDRLANNSALRMLTLVDEYTRECLKIRVERSFKAVDVQSTLSQVIQQGRPVPLYIRSDNGSEFIASALQGWMQTKGIQSTFIEPGSPWQNGKCESFNGKFRDECLNTQLFNTLFEAKAVIRQWQQHYNHRRPHSALNYLTPIQFVATLKTQCPKALTAAREGEPQAHLPQAAVSAF
jgi:putative transposase